MDTRRRFWSENEAAQLCGVPYWRLKYLRDTGRINPLRIGRAVAYSDTDMRIAKALIDAQGFRYQRTNHDDNDCEIKETE